MLIQLKKCMYSHVASKCCNAGYDELLGLLDIQSLNQRRTDIHSIRFITVYTYVHNYVQIKKKQTKTWMLSLLSHCVLIFGIQKEHHEKFFVIRDILNIYDPVEKSMIYQET